MMATKHDLEKWVLDALKEFDDGTGRIWEIAQHIWDKHKCELEDAGELFYTW